MVVVNARGGKSNLVPGVRAAGLDVRVGTSTGHSEATMAQAGTRAFFFPSILPVSPGCPNHVRLLNKSAAVSVLLQAC